MLRDWHIKQLFNSSRISATIFRESFTVLNNIFSGGDESRRQMLRRAFQSLVQPMLKSRDRISETKKSVYRKLLEELFDRQEAEKYLTELDDLSPLPEAEAIQILLDNDPVLAGKSVDFLLALAVELEVPQENIADIRRIARQTGIPDADFDALYSQLNNESARKKRLVRSGRGIVAALVIIGIFILTAKFLQSVIFGLLLACVLLPLEKFFEKRLRQKRGIAYYATAATDFIMAPLRHLSAAVMRSGSNFQLQQPDQKKFDRNIIRKAMGLTVLTALIICGAAIWGVTTLTGNYMKKVQQDIQLWEHYRDKSSATPLLAQTNYHLDLLRDKFEKLPPVRIGLDAFDKLINDPAVRAKAIETALKHSGGIFSFTTGMVGMAITIACNILLTIFFALLFLIKMAEFCRDDGSDKRKSEYLVRSFFNGIWLPGADENVIDEARRIIEGIFFRLRVWLKGYLTLILIDSSVYTTCFFFLGVPFFLPLGILAGCGIALPYIGPVLSCGTTLLVTIAAGSASGHMLVAIVICYLIYNGIIEQFILYPAVIGESLGLSTLETIIVVLLGAIFAGIPGMIFALPTASVAKYIIPQVYRGLIRK